MAIYSAKRALLANLIDYAGTFPPAALSLEKAMQQACAFRKHSKHPWLLSKIVVTIADLKRLSPRSWHDAGSDGAPLPFTVIGSPVEKPSDLARHLGFEIREVRRFNEKFLDSSQRQQVLAYETRIPESLGPEAMEALLGDALEAALVGSHLGLDIYFEIPLTGEVWQTRLSKAAHRIAGWAEENAAGVGQPGIKIRTGGATPPTASQLAEVIAVCTTLSLRFKATQGLHHAISRPGDYGFVNLFAAFAFAQSLGLSEFSRDEIQACLLESNPKAFVFTPDRLKWSRYSIECDQIEAARRRHAGTFGSCSLEEPDVFLAQEIGEEIV